ncbi:MAG: 50S ribosomal protein L10 [Coriobacteriia bacterium]|jgi:large subunit ribosomal protein L10|nr:50S ribosomal protein L10 [Coriobacteriia bacterium]MDR2714757.1 50S ribosomal protein L10 [Coriobacteriales bacterium]
MPNADKVKLVAKIKDEIEAADAIWVVDYRGLTVKQSEEMRRLIRAQDASIKVYKNSFTERALSELELPSLGEVLEGPSAFVFVSGDPVASAKTLKSFAKENEALEIKGGLFNNDVVTATQIKAIADLPSREELIAKLLGTISNPATGLVRVLSGPAEKFVRTLQAVSDSKAA